MHLIVVIAIGVFGGLWMFALWAQWVNAKQVRRALENLSPHLYPPKPKPDYVGRWMVVLGVVVVGLIGVMASLPTKPQQVVTEIVTSAQVAQYNDFLCRTGASWPDLVCPK
jgi:hypothetical protein